MEPHITVVYRSHYEGPLSKRVTQMPGQSILGWFQRAWTEVSPEKWAEAAVGGQESGWCWVTGWHHR